MRSQSDIDCIYTDWCNILKQHMLQNLTHTKRPKIVIMESTVKNIVLRSLGGLKSSHNYGFQFVKLKNYGCGVNEKNDKVRYKASYVGIRKQFDREIQRAKRLHWYSMQKNLLDECNVDQSQFWKSIGKIGISYANKKSIPMEVLSDDGSVSTNLSDILGKWQDDFRSLFTNAGQSLDVETGNANDDNLQHTYNEHINIFEVKKAVGGAKMGKAAGFDNIPTTVLKNDTAISFLHILFNICFDNGFVPSDWGKCVINPIPKSSTSDRRDPLYYRGISLAPAMYNLYCSVLNRRLSSWSEQHGKLTDVQNGFRKGRSTTDHILSLTNIIDTRKRLRKPTFCAFIDFRKAYDTINRNILWKRLSNIGISGKMFSAIKSLYLSVRSCVRVNSYKTDWFDVQCGLRQGCVLSPLLFNLFINDLAVFLKSLDLGISLGDEKISADDIVLLAESSDELQLLLNALDEWCGRNDMSVNTAKSNVIHFRPNSVSRTDVVFFWQ